MKTAIDDLPDRKVAWEALSDLYLDTDTSLNRDWRVGMLLETPYSEDELETILVVEVHPVCRWNLLGVAGEWAGFNPDWLQERILARLASRSWFRFPSISGARIRRDKEWLATKRALSARRLLVLNSPGR